MIVPSRNTIDSRRRSVRVSARVGMHLAGFSTALLLLAAPIWVQIFADLVTHRGQRQVDKVEAAAMVDWAGFPDIVKGDRSYYSSRGLLPLAADAKGIVLPRVLRWTYSHCSWARNNYSLLALLIISAGTWSLVFVCCLSFYRRFASIDGKRRYDALLKNAYLCKLRQPRHQDEDFLEDVLDPRASGVSPNSSHPHRDEISVSAAQELQSVVLAGNALFPWAWYAIGACGLALLWIHVGLGLAIFLTLYLVWFATESIKPYRQRQHELTRQFIEGSRRRLNELFRRLRMAGGHYAWSKPLKQALEMEQARDAQAVDHLQRKTFQIQAGAVLAGVVGCLAILALIGLYALNASAPLSAPEAASLLFLTLTATLLLKKISDSRRFSEHTDEISLREQFSNVPESLKPEPGGERVIDTTSDRDPLRPLQEAITLERVTWGGTSGRSLLKDVSLTIRAHEQVAFFASDEATLKALVDVLSYAAMPEQGSVLYDGTPLGDAALESIPWEIAVADAEYIWHETDVKTNISCGDSRYTDRMINKAAKRAQVSSFLHRLPQGMHTLVGGPDGITLKETQAFRITLARAFLRQPSVFIIKEPRKKLSTDEEEFLDLAVHKVVGDQTVIFLANRLSTLRRVNRIYLFHEGRLRAEGTHAELLRDSDLYRHLQYIRFNEFRDAADGEDNAEAPKEIQVREPPISGNITRGHETPTEKKEEGDPSPVRFDSSHTRVEGRSEKIEDSHGTPSQQVLKD